MTLEQPSSLKAIQTFRLSWSEFSTLPPRVREAVMATWQSGFRLDGTETAAGDEVVKYQTISLKEVVKCRFFSPRMAFGLLLLETGDGIHELWKPHLKTAIRQLIR